MGIIYTAKVVTRAEYYRRRSVLQPGNREWVTSIGCVNSTGLAFPITIIFKGKTFHYEAWYDNLPNGWRIEIIENGWATDEPGLPIRRSNLSLIQLAVQGVDFDY